VIRAADIRLAIEEKVILDGVSFDVARGEVVERTVPVHALRRTSRLWLVNALRGWVPVVLVDRGPEVGPRG